jgi:hypothetical protein
MPRQSAPAPGCTEERDEDLDPYDKPYRLESPPFHETVSGWR